MRIGRNHNHEPKPGAVAAVQSQTAQAAALAQISGQHLLSNPRTNPAVRPHADQLRDVQHRRALEAEHARVLRRYRVADHRAADAERTLEIIHAARAMSSPARSVMALHTGRRRFLGAAMTASLALSAGSAMGVAHLAKSLGASEAVGYIAEVGLTGLSTAAILYRSHITEHRGNLAGKGWQNISLWLLTVVPLLASIVANALSVGAVGVFCSLGAAAFSLLSAVISDRSAATLQQRAEEVDASDIADLQRVAMGDALGEDLLTGQPAPAAEATPAHTDEPAAEAAEGLRELEAFLANDDPDDQGDGGVTPAPDDRPDTGPHGAAADPSRPPVRPGVHIDTSGVHIDSDQPGKGDPQTRTLPAVQARREAGAQTRQAIVHYRATHPEATVQEIATALGLSRTTVKRHLRTLRNSQGWS